jgi:hypothetical protein
MVTWNQKRSTHVEQNRYHCNNDDSVHANVKENGGLLGCGPSSRD